MDYQESLAYIESLAPTILNPDLHRFSTFMEEHEQIQDRLPAIHVAGTNGKGSTVAIVDSVLRAAGLRVGRYTGPHLLRWNERFHLNGRPIDDATFACCATRIRHMSEAFGKRHPQLGALTWFEFLTALAFFYFFENGAQLAVYEVGLGGRWDATNVISQPLVSAITTIGLDHVHILGETVEEIAREKAGIIKPRVPVVTGASGSALAVIRERAQQQGAPLVVCEAPDVVQGELPVDASAFRQARSKLALRGSYQQFNGLLAAAILQVAQSRWGHSNQAFGGRDLAEGFGRVYWPGRFQYLSEQWLLLDGAHNPAGMEALRSALDEVFPRQKRLFVLSFFQNKDVPSALQALIRPGDAVFAAEAEARRAVYPAAEIAALCTAHGARAQACSTVACALSCAQEFRQQKNDSLIVATGSFASVREVMLALGWKSVEDGLVFNG